jgi:eukaryotic-like serine/threonine-protein kinase
MLPEASACLEDEVIAAFISGTLDATQIAHVDRHLAQCRSCCVVVAAAAAANVSNGDIPAAVAVGSDALCSEFLEEMAADLGVAATQPAAASPIKPGDVLADKYRVERMLGRGGMGEVFEALHVELGHRVAIKVLRHTAPTAATRFLREAQTCARLLSHHIPRVFDLGRLPGGAPYIVMERLSGEDLARLVARGPLTVADAASYVHQACAGLREAHAAGVVHRDLKPANLFLVARRGAPALVKVLDFGVSKSTPLLGSEASQRLTSTGIVLGSPAYMSPEQIRAHEDVDARTDIWSLGAVLYELVTGKTPFRAATLSALSVAIVTETPAAPSTLRPGLPVAFDRVVLQCLEKDRAMRFESVDALAAALAPFVSLGTPAPRRVGSRWARSRWLASALVLGALAASGAVWLTRRERLVTSPSAAAALPPRRSVAVIGLRSTSDRSTDSWLGAAIADLLRTELASGDELRILAPERVARLKRDLDLGETDSLERVTLTRVHEMIDADIALVGSYWKLDNSDELRIDVTLQGTASGETLASLAEHGPQSELFAIVSNLGEHLRKKLGAEAVSADQQVLVRRMLPSDVEAQKWYAEGRAAFDGSDYLAATRLLGKVVEREPGFPLGYGMLSEAWGSLGYGNKAREFAERALAANSSYKMPHKEELLLQARAFLWTAQAPRAVELCRSLFTVFPDDLDFGLALARAQVLASQGNEVQATIAQLQALPPPNGDDPRIDLAEADAAQAVSDSQRRVTAAHRAFEKARVLGMRSLQVEARLAEAKALFSTGRRTEAKALFIEARDQFAEVHDLGGAAIASFLLGQLRIVTATEDRDRGKRELADAAETFERIGDRQNAAHVRNTLAIALAQERKLEAAEAEFRSAREGLAEVGFQVGAITAQINIATVLTVRGKFSEAEGLFAEALSLSRKTGERGLEGASETGLASVFIRLGRLDEARERYESGLRITLEANDASNVVDARLQLAELLRFSAQPAAAREQLARATEGAREIQDPEYLDDTSLLRMTLDLDEHDPTAVLEQRGAWSERFGAPHRECNEARARSRFALALLAQGQLPEAEREVDAATRLVEGSEDVRAVMDVALANAKVRATLGRPEVAASALRALMPLSKRAGRPMEYEVRLLLGEVEKASHTPGWHERVSAVAESAKQEKLTLYAERAAALFE